MNGNPYSLKFIIWCHADHSVCEKNLRFELTILIISVNDIVVNSLRVFGKFLQVVFYMELYNIYKFTSTFISETVTKKGKG